MIDARNVLARYLSAAGKKPKAEPPDAKLADQASRESDARKDKLKKALEDVEALGKKLQGRGGAKAQKPFDKAYDDIHELGEKAAESAEKLVKEYGDTIAQGTRGEDKAQREAAMDMLELALRQWKLHETSHFKPTDTRGKMQQAEQTFGYAAELETYVGQIGRALKGDYMVADKWFRSP